MADAALSETGNELIKDGGNNPPSPVDEVFAQINDLYDEAKNWADGADIESEEQHDAVSKLYDDLHEAGKRADALRVEEKKPLDEKIKAIQDRFNPFIQPKKGKVDLGKSSLNDLLAGWRAKIAAEKQRKADEARREAEAQEIAAQQAMQASKGDLEAREQAEELETARKESEKVAKRAEREATSGLGLRTYYHPELTDLSAAIQHYWKVRRSDFEQLVIQLAKEDVRQGKREIPGFEVKSEQRAI